MSVMYHLFQRRHRAAVIFSLALTSLAPAGAQDVLTERFNNARTGVVQQPNFSASVFASGWRRLGEYPVSEQERIYAQPLVVNNFQMQGGQRRNVVLIATDHDKVYAFDAAGVGQSALLWSRSLAVAPKEPDPTRTGSGGCDSISPNVIGIEATPAVDKALGRLFVSYRVVRDRTRKETAEQRLAAVDIRSGQVVQDVIVRPSGFNPVWHRSRASLLLRQDVLFVAYGSRCEDPGKPIFHGWIVAFDARTLRQLGVFRTTGRDVDGGGVWQASSGIAADDEAIFVTTGNRRPATDWTPDPDAGDTSLVPEPNLDFASSVLRIRPVLSTDPLGGPPRFEMQMQDFFTPYRKSWLDADDFDMGASGPVVMRGTNFLISIGKQGMLYVLDRRQLGRLDAVKAQDWNQKDWTRLDATADQFPDDAAADDVHQKFQVGFNQYIPEVPTYLAKPGSSVVAIKQHDTQVDIFFVGRDGAIYVTKESDNGAWWDGVAGRLYPQRITPPGRVLPGSCITAAKQNDTQLDVFYVGSDGAAYVTKESNDGRWTDGIGPDGAPFRITPQNWVPEQCLAAGKQNDTQLDVFFVGVDGAIHVTKESNDGPWTDGIGNHGLPFTITPTSFVPPQACLTAAKQNDTQLDVFFVRDDGAAYVTKELNDGPWTDGVGNRGSPFRITPTNFVPLHACLAAAQQNPTQLDVFFVRDDGAAYVTKESDDGPWTDGVGTNGQPFRITPINSVPISACLGAARQNDTQLDLFYVAGDHAAYVTKESNDGPWTDGVGNHESPFRITDRLAPKGACITAVRQNDNQLDAFIIGNTGAPYLTWESNDGPWRDGPLYDPSNSAVRLSRALWLHDWPAWPHIHGNPVFATYPDGTSSLYVWPEKDFLRAYAFDGNRFANNNPKQGIDSAGKRILAPDGMPGGMLSLSIDSTQRRAGVLFASLSRDESTDGPGILRAFDAFSLRELWNNAGEDYRFSKFVPATIANGRVYLPTCSAKVLIYGTP